jgi:RimJ/RimL family protein N-acetyltransferase
VGSILPDVFLVLGFVAHYLENFTHSAMAAALHALLHHSTLHTVTLALHSFVMVGPFLALSAVLYRPALPFFVGMLAHGIVDFLTHRQWAYNHVFPLPFAPIRSIVSYTDVGIYGGGACTAPALCGVVGAETEGPSMYDLIIDDFPPDRLAEIVHWRNDPAVHRYLRQGILTLETVQAWYTQYFSRAEHQLFAVYADKALIGYGTLSHIDPTHRNREIGIVIGNPDYWNKGLGTLAVTRLTTLAFTRYRLHRVYAVIQGGNIASRRCFEKVSFQHEGRLRDARYVNEAFIDIHYYAILEDEWQY